MLEIYASDGKCPKCRFKKISTIYRQVPPFGIPLDGYWEYIVRECLRCNYKWFESTLCKAPGELWEKL